MTGIGYPDWQPIVALSDNPQLIGFGLSGQIPYSQSVLDVRQWSSFILSAQYEAANVAPPQNTAVCRLRWWDAVGMGNEVDRQDYEINSVNTTDCGRTLLSDAMRGPFMSIDFLAGSGAPSTLTFVLFGSNRAATRSRATELGPTLVKGIATDRMPFLFRSNPLPAGLTKLAARMCLGEATVSIGIGGAGGPVNIRMYSPAQFAGAGNPAWYSRSGMAVGFEVHEAVIFPRRVQVIEINNTGAAGPDFSMAISVGDN